MTTYVYPADRSGCGMFRLAWPAMQLQRAGYDVRFTFPDQRWDIGAKLNSIGDVVDVVYPPDATTIVIQRSTHHTLVDCIPFWQRAGIRVVVDVDDDLSCIHPSNPAFNGLRPGHGPHSWLDLQRACRMADVVTVTTPALAAVYRHDAAVLPNYLPDSYFGLPVRQDHSTLSWPASLASHPNDAVELGSVLEAVAHQTGVDVSMLGPDKDARHYEREFGLRAPPRMIPFCDTDVWPLLLSGLGIAVAPLADTRFNKSKSWLKVLELAAAGVPWVASDRVEYRRFYNQARGGGGVLAARPSDWRRELKALIGSPDLRAERSVQGRIAASRYRLSDHAGLWAVAWGAERASGGTPSPTGDTRGTHPVLRPGAALGVAPEGVRRLLDAMDRR